MAERRALRIPLAVLGPVTRRRRFGLLLPLIAVAALVAGLLAGGDETDPGAAALAPPDTALFVRAQNRDEVWALVRRFPSLRALELERDVRPWVGDELALAVPAAGGAPLLIAEVADRAGAERYRAQLERPSAFAGDFLVVGVDAAPDGPSLADTPVYRRAAELDRAPVELYAPAAGLRRALENAPAALRAAGAFAEAPHFEGLAARVRSQSGGLRISARLLRSAGAPPAQEFAPALQGRAPASAAAFLDVPGADALVTLLERGGAGDLVAGVRAALPGLAGLDLDREVLGPLGAEAAVTLTASGATPVFTLTARTDNPALTREALARLQEPLAEQLTGEAERLPGARRQRVLAARHPHARALVRDRRQRRDRLHDRLRAVPAHPRAARSRAGAGPSRGVGSDRRQGRGASLCRLTPASCAGRADGAEPRPGLPSRARRPPAGTRRRCRRQARGVRFDRGAVPRDPMNEMNDNEYLFTSESVTEGHPDKIADQISDGVLDAVMRDDPNGRVACETLVNTGLVVVSGEISTSTYVDIQDVARETIRKIGYTDADLGFSADSCAVINAIDKQSPDIAQGVDTAYEARLDASDDDELDIAGAGDQGMMFGYASSETEELMPLPISLAHKLAHRLAAVRHAEIIPYLRPDGKTQVSVRYRDGKPVEIEKLLISTQHKEGAETLIPDDLWEHVVEPILPKDLYDGRKLRKNFLVNPTGRFVIGGPVGDAGLTGRKIIVDTYGGMARHGGGAFSGKDPSKVDRSAAYAARYVAKNVVAAGLAERCEVQVAYAIGVAHPVSVMVETFGTEAIGRSQILALINEHFDLRPGAFREYLKLHRPIYQKTAAYGHFGREDHDFTWEKTDKAQTLREAAGLGAAASSVA